MASVLSVGMFLPSGQLKLYRGEAFDFFPDRFKAHKNLFPIGIFIKIE